MGKSKRGDVHGWVILDKPHGLTSTQALGKVRRIMGAQRAGHGGTLDPLATGVLPLAFGEATKTIPFVIDGTKAYRFAVTWGAETTTADLEGEITSQSDKRPTAAAIRAILPHFTGDIAQVPPVYSAIKVDGARAYDLARAGEAVELSPRTVTVHALAFLEEHSTKDEGWFEVTCSKGTYVRSLAVDIGRALGCFGHVSVLRRIAAGAFLEAHAISLEKLEALGHKACALEALLPLATALDDIPALAVTAEEASDLRMGRSLRRPGAADGLVRCLDHATIVALGEVEDGVLKPARVFNP